MFRLLSHGLSRIPSRCNPTPTGDNELINVGKNACKILAKDLVRTRRYIQKFTQMRVQLQAVSLRMQTLRSNEQMATAMKGATRVSHAGSYRTLLLSNGVDSGQRSWYQ